MLLFNPTNVHKLHGRPCEQRLAADLKGPLFSTRLNRQILTYKYYSYFHAMLQPKPHTFIIIITFFITISVMYKCTCNMYCTLDYLHIIHIKGKTMTTDPAIPYTHKKPEPRELSCHLQGGGFACR